MMVWLIFILLGIAAGTLAGLFGVGGGLIIVPALIIVFAILDFPEQISTHMAVATSLATIVFTGASATYNHHLKGGIHWSTVGQLTIGIALGAFLGKWIATQLNGEHLQLIIGMFALFMGVKLLLPKKTNEVQQLPKLFSLLNPVAGVFIGGLSAIFGIGGGTLTVPYLAARNWSMKQAVSMSSACGFFIALFAATYYGFAQTSETIAYSTGLIYWPGVAGIVLTSVYFARLGAKLAHQLNEQTLKRAFAALLLIVGSKMALTGLGII